MKESMKTVMAAARAGYFRSETRVIADLKSLAFGFFEGDDNTPGAEVGEQHRRQGKTNLPQPKQA